MRKTCQHLAREACDEPDPPRGAARHCPLGTARGGPRRACLAECRDTLFLLFFLKNPPPLLRHRLKVLFFFFFQRSPAASTPASGARLTLGCPGR